MPELENLPEEALLDDIGEKSLRRILESMVSTIEGSKSQIFDVYEAAHSEVESSKKNLQDAKRLTQEVIDEVDALEEQEQKEKQKLVLVSSSFSDYSEEKIQEAYESVKNVQVQLGIAREKERQLRRQRNQLELRLYHLQKTVESAQKLAMRISSMLSYLGTQISDVVIQLEAASKNKYLSAAIIRAQEDERLRVSREIHDGPAQ
ncbi:MAG: sensor histidine kinase, partial [Schwartzia sp.]|nr:sensor histidine kinase [Schwartzia sp. (in: firmicutes)]